MTIESCFEKSAKQKQKRNKKPQIPHLNLADLKQAESELWVVILQVYVDV